MTCQGYVEKHCSWNLISWDFTSIFQSKHIRKKGKMANCVEATVLDYIYNLIRFISHPVVEEFLATYIGPPPVIVPDKQISGK